MNVLTSSKILGSSLKEARKAKGLTQADLYKLTNITQTIISRIELGKESVRFDTLLRITSVLDIEIQFCPKQKATGDW